MEIGRQAGLDCKAIISDMNQPLGHKVGNALEIEETLDLLKGQGPADLLELVLTLGSEMAVMGKKAANREAGRKLLEETIADGSALAKFKQMIIAQGGDGRVVDDYSLLPHAKDRVVVTADRAGVISQLTADEIGVAAMLLGGGRQTASDQLDYGVGIEVHHKLGDRVAVGDPLFTIHSNQADLTEVEAMLAKSLRIGDQAPRLPLVYEWVD